MIGTYIYKRNVLFFYVLKDRMKKNTLFQFGCYSSSKINQFFTIY